MNDLPLAMFAHPGIPTAHWEPQCDLCRLYRTNQAASEWLTRELLDMRQSQDDIRAELLAKFGVRARQPQLSHHRVHHLLPDLRAAYEAFVAAQAVLAEYGEMPAIELAQRANKIILMKLVARAEQATDPKEQADLARAIAQLSHGLVQGEQASVGVELDEEELATKRAQRALADGEFEEAFVAWVKENPHRAVELAQSKADGAEPTGG